MTLLGEGTYLALNAAVRTTKQEGRAAIGSDVLLRACTDRARKAVPRIGFALYEVRNLVEQPEEPTGADPGDSVAEGPAALREANWVGQRYTSPVAEPWSSSEALPWSAAVRACVDGAIADASSLGLPHSGVRHLMIRLLSEAPRAIDLVQHAGRRPAAVIGHLSADRLTRTPSTPWTPSANRMRRLGISQEPRWLLRQLYHSLRRSMTGTLTTEPMLLLIELEANRQCIRLGHDQVDPRHLILAIASIDEQLQMETGRRAQVVPHNNCGAILRGVGIDYRTLRAHAHRIGAPQLPVSDFLPEGPRGPAWTIAAARAVNVVARRYTLLGPDHVLAAVVTEPDAVVESLFEMAGTTAATIRDQLASTLAA